MDITKRLSRWILPLAGAFALAACTGEPTEADLQQAVKRQVSAQNASLEKLLGKDITQATRQFTGEIKGVRKIGCKLDGERAYRCDIELEIEHLGTLAREPASYRFVKGSEGWMVAR